MVPLVLDIPAMQSLNTHVELQLLIEEFKKENKSFYDFLKRKGKTDIQVKNFIIDMVDLYWPEQEGKGTSIAKKKKKKLIIKN